MLVAMRRYADRLRDRGLDVDYVRAEDLAAGLRAHQGRYRPQRIRLMEPKTAGGRRSLGRLAGVELVPCNLFLTDPAEFSRWAHGRRRLLMEDFYRGQRRRTGLLMDGDEPAGGRWNFDPENRRPAPADAVPPAPYRPREDAVDEQVRHELDRSGVDTWGEDGPRLWPADRDQARRALRRFVEHALHDFGPYQDAMLGGQRTMWHSLLSSSLNLGLLSPLECAEAAERAYREDRASLASVEGFIRQLIGWREYVWCMYWHCLSRWPSVNALGANAPLPSVLDGGETRMRCLDDAVGGLQKTAYAHHIERLMLFGNLLLLTGTDPRQALDWFHRSFIDGYEWVMAPNVLGMAVWADGGAMMTKPYAASGRYVDRMSDHCAECFYRPGDRVGDHACPFTTLYWDFLARNRKRLAGNRRMAMPIRNLERIDEAELHQLRRRAKRLRVRFDA